MPGPEGAPAPERSEETYTSSFTAEEARQHLGQERAHARTSLSDKREGYLDTERHASDLTANEHFYRAAIVSETTREAREMQEAGKSQDEILAFVRERILDEQRARMTTELNARENPEGKFDQVKAGFIKHWRAHPRLRLAAGVGLVVATGGFAAAGLGGLALGTAGARAALSAASGYMGAKGAQEAGGNWLNRREGGTFFNPGKAGELAPATTEEIAAMTSQQRLERMAAILSAKTLPGRTEKQVGSDAIALDSLHTAEAQSIDAELAAKAERYFGANLVNGSMAILRERVSGQMEAERTRLQYDKKLNRRRSAIAGALGAAAGVSSLISGLDHAEVAHHAKHAVTAAHHGLHHNHASNLHGHGMIGETGGTPGPGGGHELHLTQHALHMDHDAPGHAYPEVVVAPVDAHENASAAALKHLRNTVEFHRDLNPEQQKQAVQRLAAHMVKEAGPNGPQWRYSRADMIKAIFGHNQ